METLRCRARGTWETQRKGKETLILEKSMPEKPRHEERHWWKLWHIHELALLGERKAHHLPWQSVQEIVREGRVTSRLCCTGERGTSDRFPVRCKRVTH